MTLRGDLERTINRHSAENGSNTPDFILAEYVMRCLEAFDSCVLERDKWYGRLGEPGTPPTDPDPPPPPPGYATVIDTAAPTPPETDVGWTAMPDPS